jgi:hypothetical protein
MKKTLIPKKACMKCQEIKPIKSFLDWLDNIMDDCESCNLFDKRLMIVYKRELTNDLDTYPYF